MADRTFAIFAQNVIERFGHQSLKADTLFARTAGFLGPQADERVDSEAVARYFSMLDYGGNRTRQTLFLHLGRDPGQDHVSEAAR